MEEHVSYEATGRPSVFAQHNIQALLVKVTDRQMTVQTLITHQHTPDMQREAVQLFNRSKMLLFLFCACLKKLVPPNVNMKHYLETISMNKNGTL